MDRSDQLLDLIASSQPSELSPSIIDIPTLELINFDAQVMLRHNNNIFHIFH